MKKFWPIAVAFFVTTLLLFLFGKSIRSLGIDSNFLLGANCVLFLLTTGGFLMQLRGAMNMNPNVMMQGISASLLLKFFLVIISVILYVVVFEGSIQTGALLITFLLYVIYTALEVIQLLKVLRSK